MRVTKEESKKINDFAETMLFDCVKKMELETFNVSSMSYIFSFMLASFWKVTNFDEETMRYNTNLIIDVVLMSQSKCEEENDNE